MSFKRAVAVVGLVATMGTVGVNALAPHSATDPAEQQRQEQRQLDKQASEVQKKRNRELREQGTRDGEAEIRRRGEPVEVRPPEPEPRLRFRIVP